MILAIYLEISLLVAGEMQHDSPGNFNLSISPGRVGNDPYTFRLAAIRAKQSLLKDRSVNWLLAGTTD